MLNTMIMFVGLDSRWLDHVDMYRGGSEYCPIAQYLLIVFTIFDVLEGPIHGGNELETSNCN
jgi:hypothetical protein